MNKDRPCLGISGAGWDCGTHDSLCDSCADRKIDVPPTMLALIEKQHADAVSALTRRLEELKAATPLEFAREGLDFSALDDDYPRAARTVDILREQTGETIRFRFYPSKSTGFWRLEVHGTSGMYCGYETYVPGKKLFEAWEAAGK